MDNTRNKDKIKGVEIKLERIIKLASPSVSNSGATGLSANASTTFDITIKETLHKQLYEGIDSFKHDKEFNRNYELDLKNIFKTEILKANTKKN